MFTSIGLIEVSFTHVQRRVCLIFDSILSISLVWNILRTLSLNTTDSMLVRLVKQKRSRIRTRPSPRSCIF
jgi:hypothetical protein